jgi:GTP-binding protein HflX
LRWESVLKRRVVDLPELILDGLARHSASAETHILVEMAQLLLLRGRLPRKGPLFSRMGEGVGTQAPGHHLEVTRAGLQTRLHQIRREWKKLDETRALQCQSRSSLPRAVLLGFPNSGKTQLFRRLTGEDVPCSHSPYSTLHTLTRRVAIPAIDPFLVTDTLSFIPGLFAEGLSAFRPTLRWIQSAEVLVLVLDAGSAWVEEHLTEMNEFLKQIGCAEKARVTVFNQMDRVEHPGNLRELARDIQPHVCISARLDREFAGLGAMIHQSYREAMQSLAAGGEEEWP